MTHESQVVRDSTGLARPQASANQRSYGPGSTLHRYAAGGAICKRAAGGLPWRTDQPPSHVAYGAIATRMVNGTVWTLPPSLNWKNMRLESFQL